MPKTVERRRLFQKKDLEEIPPDKLEGLLKSKHDMVRSRSDLKDLAELGGTGVGVGAAMAIGGKFATDHPYAGVGGLVIAGGSALATVGVGIKECRESVGTWWQKRREYYQTKKDLGIPALQRVPLDKVRDMVWENRQAPA